MRWLLFGLLCPTICSCGDSDASDCEDRTYGPDQLTAVSCAPAGDQATLTFSAAPCWGPPDSCSFLFEDGALRVTLVKEFCDTGEPESTGCAAASTFTCTGPAIPAGTYSVDGRTLTVASDGSCSL